MAQRWLQLHWFVLAGLCFCAAAAEAQQPTEPPYYAVPGAHPAKSGAAANPVVYTPPGEDDGIPVVAPVPAPHPGYQLPSAYWPPVGYPGPYYGPPAAVMPPAYAPVLTGEGYVADGNKGGGLLQTLKQGCNCEGSAEAHAHPIAHFFLLDCWAHHDEMGCSSFCSEVRFALGSCRAYFGERCGPNPPRVPVPPGYTVLPPDIRSGPPVEVPPNPYPKNRQ